MENVLVQHVFGFRVAEIAAFVERLGAPNLGICLDSGHAHASGLDVAQAVRTAGKHLRTLHLHDNFGGPDVRLSIKIRTATWFPD